MMRDLNALATFVAVVNAGSFTLAAERCGISKALASRQVLELETSLGVKLIKRSTRKLGLTQAGERFFERCSRLVSEADEAVRDVEELARGSHGLIRISTAITFGRMHLLPAVHEFLKHNPSIQIDVTLSERFADLISGNADLVVRLAEAPRLSNMVARRLAPVRWVLVASPDYIARAGLPRAPRDLLDHNCLVYDKPRGMEWRLIGPQGEVTIKVKGSLRANVAEGLVGAAVAGIGVAALPSFAAAEQLRAGRLVRVLPEHALPESTLYAVFLPDRRLPERIRTFVQFLADRFAGEQPYWEAAQAPAARKRAASA